MYNHLKGLGLLLVFLIVIISEPLFGQEIKVSTRNIENPEDAYIDESHNSYPKIGVTLDPLRFISGEMPVSLQVAPINYVEIELGTGITWKNYVMQALQGDDASSEYLTEYPVEIIHVNPSYLFELKVFPTGDALNNGWYLGFRYQFRKYSRDVVTPTDESIYTNVDFKDLMVLYGIQGVLEESGIYIDYYAGMGARIIEGNDLKSTYISGKETFGTEMFNSILPTVILGIKIGYLLKN